MQNSLCIQVLHFSILAALLHGSRAAGVSQTLRPLRRGTRNGNTELSQRAPPIFGRAAIMLGIGPHSSLWPPYVIGQAIYIFMQWFLLSSLWPPYVIGGPLYFCPVISIFYLSIFLSFFPRLISAATDWISTILLHMAWPLCEFRMQV